MANAFDAALAVLHADPNVSLPALHRAGGIGPATPIRVIRSAPDAYVEPFQKVRSHTEHLSIRRVDCPTLAVADTIEVEDPAAPAPVLLVVLTREIDAEGITWSAEMRRA